MHVYCTFFTRLGTRVELFRGRRNRRKNWFIPTEFRLFRGTQKSRNSVPNPFHGREKCSEFRTVEKNWSKTLGILFRTIQRKRKQLGIPEFMPTKILSSWHIPLTRIEKPYNKWQVFFLGYFCTFELYRPEIGHLVAVYLTAKRGSHKFQKYGQKRRLLKYRQIIFWLFRKAIFPRNSVPFRASEWALPRNSEFRRNKHFFREITESVPRQFCGIFFGTKFRCQPYWALECSDF